MMTNLFAYYTQPGHPRFPGAPFILATLLLLISAGLAYRSMKREHALQALQEKNIL
jgi:DHA1 family tetracycline resistance protein-like MFS transporter